VRLVDKEPEIRPSVDLQSVHAHLRALCVRDYPNGVPFLYERLLPKLPEHIRSLVRRKLNLIVREETGNPDALYSQLERADREALFSYLDPQVLRVHKEVGQDFALSNATHTITHFETLPPVVSHELMTVAVGNNPKPLERMGCVFFDVDGTKTIVDCTSHSRAGKYLEAMAEFLSSPPPSVQSWLSERELRSEVYAYAGDEFIVMIGSEEEPIDKALLDAFAVEVQKALASDQKLRSCVSFDNPAFVMEYDDWSREDRVKYKQDPASMADRFQASRRTLKDFFEPSVSAGSATFMEALHDAISADTEGNITLEDLGVNAFRLMVAEADARLKEDKRIFRENLEDPLLKAFLLRNAENRRLMNESERLRSKYRRAIRKIVELKKSQRKRDEYWEGIVQRITKELEAHGGTAA